MTTITKSMTSQTGKKVELTINVENARVAGTALVNGKGCTVTGIAKVQGRTCLTIKNGPAPYLPIDQALYSQIESTAKAQYRAKMSDEEILEGRLREAEAKYNRLFARGYDNVAIINAREEWDRLSAEYHAKYG